MARSSRDVVLDFYRSIAASDGAALASLVDAEFADDAAIEWPASLPHGGRVEGARRLRAVLAASAKPDAPAGITNLELRSVIGDGDEVVAWITFDWKHPDGSQEPNAALELWRFADGKASEIRAFYWDTDLISRPTERTAP